jgi:hypothetical protein
LRWCAGAAGRSTIKSQVAGALLILGATVRVTEERRGRTWSLVKRAADLTVRIGAPKP